MSGGVVSCTVTVVVACALFPDASVAVNVTVVTPRGKTAGALLDTGSTPPQLSVAVGSGTTTGVPASAVCSTLMGAGTLASTGASRSTTLIVAWQEPDR